MNTQPIEYKAIAFKARKRVMLFLVILLLLSACASLSDTSQPARVEEITFQSGEFTLVGDLQLPAGRGPFPIVLFIHGSGPADRISGVYFPPIMERMLRAGYATFAWDKPGSGESTGTLSNTHVISERAQILLDAVDLMKKRPDIDPQRIGLWGISQAG